MKQQDVFKKLGGIITEINEQYEYLRSVNGESNDLELELLMANAHFLSDHIDILRKLNAQAAKAREAVAAQAPKPTQPPPPVAETSKPAPAPTPPPVAEPSKLTPASTPVAETPKPTPPPVAPEPVAAPEPQYFQPIMAVEEEDAPVFEFDVENKIETEEAEETIAEPEIVPEPVLPEPETIRHELTLEDIGEDWDEDESDEDDIAAEIAPDELDALKEAPVAQPAKQPVAEDKVLPEPAAEKPAAKQATPKPEPEPQPEAKPHTQIMVAEDEIITINQKMSAQMGATRMSDQLKGQPIGDLKSAITLNDKLLYIRELFNGYSLAYSEALDLLNRMQSFEEAQTFLSNSYATKNNWADKQAVADKFYALLQRRYL